jgi:hypothetical protein
MRPYLLPQGGSNSRHSDAHAHIRLPINLTKLRVNYVDFTFFIHSVHAQNQLLRTLAACCVVPRWPIVIVVVVVASIVRATGLCRLGLLKVRANSLVARCVCEK